MKNKIIILMLIIFVVTLALSPSECIRGAAGGIELCVNVILPSLFPFFVLARLLIDSGAVEALAARAGWIMPMAFNLPRPAVFALVMGMVSGYPVGAKCAVMLYEKKLCTKEEAERVTALCNNSGPLFIIGAVGAGMLGSRNVGIALYIIHILSAIITAVMLRYALFRNKKTSLDPLVRTRSIPPPLGESLPVAVKSSVELIAYVCGFIIFFSAMLAIMERIGMINLMSELMQLLRIPQYAAAAISAGIFEITRGISNAAAGSLPVGSKLVIASALLAWSGISVILQVQGVVYKYKFNMKFFICSKIIQAVIAAVMTSVYILL